jgi:hypothetical protein
MPVGIIPAGAVNGIACRNKGRDSYVYLIKHFQAPSILIASALRRVGSVTPAIASRAKVPTNRLRTIVGSGTPRTTSGRILSRVCWSNGSKR